MLISKTAGLITAARAGRDRPLAQLGDISAVRRMVLTMRQAGMFPIVVVTAPQDKDVRYELSSSGVVFLEAASDEGDQLAAVKQGLAFLAGKTGRVCYAPVNTPLFRAQTCLELMRTSGDVVSPVYEGSSGHPVLLSQDAIAAVSDYDGADGLRGALHGYDGSRVWVEVDDPGVLIGIAGAGELDEYVVRHSETLVYPHVSIVLGAEKPFFDARTKLLLFLLDETGNMRRAAGMMALSYGKAWILVNELEAAVGYPVVERKQGGSSGGSTHLAEAGRALLVEYQAFEEAVFAFAQKEFRERVHL
jgi:molybdate transport repressor ModE-like protein